MTTEARTAGALQGWIITASCWLAVIGSVLIAPLLPFMEEHFSSYPNAKVLVTLALVTPALMIAVSSPLSGMIIDRFGRKRVFVGALVIYTVAGTAPVWLDNLYAIIATRMIVGLTESLLTTLTMVLTADYFTGRSRERWFSLQAGSAAIVAVVMFGLGGYLGTLSLGWRTPFLVYGSMIVLLPFVLAFLWEPDERADVAAAIRASFPWRLVGHICVITVFSSIVFYVVPVQLSFLLHDRGFGDSASIGIASAIANIGGPAGSFAFQATSRQPIPRLLTASMALFAAGFLIMSKFTGGATTVVGAFVASAGGGVVLPLLLAWTTMKLPFEQRGRGSGAFTGSFFLGQFVSPIAVLGLSAQVGGLDQTIWILGAICTAMACASLAWSFSAPGTAIRLTANTTELLDRATS
jgi:MFS family permease